MCTVVKQEKRTPMKAEHFTSKYTDAHEIHFAIAQKALKQSYFHLCKYFYILTFFTFLHFPYVEVNFHSKTLRRSSFSFQDSTQRLIFISRPYAEVNFHTKTLRRG